MGVVIEDLIHKLRSIADAYPEDIFPPLSEKATIEHSGIVTRASAGMGRHLGQFLKEAADALEEQAKGISETTSRLREWETRISGALVDAACVPVPAVGDVAGAVQAITALGSYAERLHAALLNLVAVETVVVREYGSGSDYYKERYREAWQRAEAALAKGVSREDDLPPSSGCGKCCS